MDTSATTRMPVGTRSFEESPTEHDDALVNRYVEAGDERAFVALMKRHLTRIRRVLYGLLNGNREDMQDVEQEILAGLFRDLKRFRFDARLETYLYRYARNKAIDHIRAQSRQRRLVEAVGERCPIPDETRAFDHSENRATLSELLSRLTEEERLIVTLKELEGMRVREIAEVLGVAEGTVKSRLHRTRRKIAELAGGDDR